MKINVDKKNNRVIVNGFYRGRKIKAIAHCHEPVFNKEFGTELAKRKYKIKEEMVKKHLHESYIRELHEMVLWCYNQIKYENEIVEALDQKIGNKTKECEGFVNTHFKGEK